MKRAVLAGGAGLLILAGLLSGRAGPAPEALEQAPWAWCRLMAERAHAERTAWDGRTMAEDAQLRAALQACEERHGPHR